MTNITHAKLFVFLIVVAIYTNRTQIQIRHYISLLTFSTSEESLRLDCCLDELKHTGLVRIGPDHNKASASSFLCYSTTQPLYQGAGKPEEQAKESG